MVLMVGGDGAQSSIIIVSSGTERGKDGRTILVDKSRCGDHLGGGSWSDNLIGSSFPGA